MNTQYTDQLLSIIANIVNRTSTIDPFTLLEHEYPLKNLVAGMINHLGSDINDRLSREEKLAYILHFRVITIFGTDDSVRVEETGISENVTVYLLSAQNTTYILTIKDEFYNQVDFSTIITRKTEPLPALPEPEPRERPQPTRSKKKSCNCSVV